MKIEVTHYPNLEITTRVVCDDEGRIIEHEWHPYNGPVADCKGGNSQAEMQAADQQRAMENQLLQQQLGMQMKQLNAVNSVVDPMIAAGGLAPGVESAMTSLVMNQLPQTFRDLSGQINQNLTARGITGGQIGAGSGDVARNFGQLGAMQAAMQQQGLSNIQLQKQSALMGDLGLKLGIGSQFGQNVGGFNQGAIGSLNAGVNAAQNADQASTGLWGSLIGGLSGLASPGNWLGKPTSGGCWIAFAVYGDGDPRAEFARYRLWTRAMNQPRYTMLMTLYLAIGQQTAWLVKRIPPLKRFFRKVFDTFIQRELTVMGDARSK